MYLKNLLIIVFVILLFIPNSLGLDNTIPTPYCLNYAYDEGYSFIVNEFHATLSNSSDYSLYNGYFYATNDRLVNGVNVLCTISDPTTMGSIPSIHRVFGTDALGNVFYFDNTIVDYSDGFWSPANPSSGLNNIGILAPTNEIRKIAIDSEGSVYVADGENIYKYVKSSEFTSFLWHSLEGGVDYTPVSCSISCTTNEVIVLDMKFDQYDNLHVLIGTYATSQNTAHYIEAYLSKTALSSSGEHISTDLLTAAFSNFNPYNRVGFKRGGLIIDSTNPTHNYTYAYHTLCHNEAFTPCASYPNNIYIYHNSTAGTTQVIGSATPITFTEIYDIEYLDNKIYVAGAPNLIRSYGTDYIGYYQISGGGSPPELSYTTSTINIKEDNYYNNTPITVSYNINVDLSYETVYCDLINCQNDYRWKMQLNDPNDVQVAFDISGTCIDAGNLINNYCTLDRTLIINPPPHNWSTGIYTASLIEYNINTYAESVLDTDTTTILNLSSNQTGIIITEPIISGTGATALTQIDGIVALMGFGVNILSKFLFALIIVVVMVLAGFLMSNNNIMGGMIVGALPFCFFTFISYIPAWVIIVVMLIVALKVGWFR